jgi:capsular polysaccharide biosynthesis protein
VSRRLAGKRRLANEPAVADLFRAHGFEIIEPERLSVPDQVAAFAGASHIAGPVGSGLYNAVFAPADVRRVILAPSNFHTPNDLLLSRDLAPAYVIAPAPTDDRRAGMRDDWAIDPCLVRRAVRQWLAPGPSRPS